MATKTKKIGLTKLDEVKLVERLSKEVRFQPKELGRLINIYKKYLKGAWYMDTSTFSEFMYNSFGFNEDFFIKRMFLAADTNNDDRIELEEFIRMVATMLRGSRTQKMEFCFKCYDLSENGELTRDDITALLVEGITESPYKEVNPEDVRDLADMIFFIMDKDRDGFISREEYKDACMKDWLLTQSFGQCLPDHKFCLINNYCHKKLLHTCCHKTNIFYIAQQMAGSKKKFSVKESEQDLDSDDLDEDEID